MGNARLSRETRKPPDHQVPAYFLYGERLRAPDERLIHVETIAETPSGCRNAINSQLGKVENAA
jgi:hypothetical protein